MSKLLVRGVCRYVYFLGHHLLFRSKEKAGANLILYMHYIEWSRCWLQNIIIVVVVFVACVTIAVTKTWPGVSPRERDWTLRRTSLNSRLVVVGLRRYCVDLEGAIVSHPFWKGDSLHDNRRPSPQLKQEKKKCTESLLPLQLLLQTEMMMMTVCD